MNECFSGKAYTFKHWSNAASARSPNHPVPKFNNAEIGQGAHQAWLRCRIDYGAHHLTNWHQKMGFESGTVVTVNLYLLKVNNRNTRKKIWNMLKVNNKDTKTKSLRSNYLQK